MIVKAERRGGVLQNPLVPHGKNTRTLIGFLLLLLALLFPFRGAGGAISYVQSPGSFSQYFGFGPSSVDIPITANVAAGNSVIVTFLWGGWSSAETTSCTDSQGNSYSVDVNEYYSGAGLYTIVCSAHNVSALGTSDMITLTFSSGTYGVAATVHEFSGLAAVATIDQAASNNGSSATPSSGSTATTTQADELLVGAIGVSGPPTDSFTPGSGYTVLSSIGFTGVWNGTIRPEYQIVSATGSYQADGTLGTSSGWAAGIATYKAAAATPPSLPVTPMFLSWSTWTMAPSKPPRLRSWTRWTFPIPFPIWISMLEWCKGRNSGSGYSIYGFLAGRSSNRDQYRALRSKRPLLSASGRCHDCPYENQWHRDR